MAATNSLFETQVCGRCGGTGHYSYNQINGTTCFGCAGSKVNLTKRGKAAQAWYTAQQTVPASEVKVGDYVFESDYFGGVRGWFRVDANDNGNLSLSYQRKGDSERKTLGMHGMPKFRVRPATKFERLWQQAVALAYQSTLTKAGTPRKGK
jgi:hypothetical protein